MGTACSIVCCFAASSLFAAETLGPNASLLEAKEGAGTRIVDVFVGGQEGYPAYRIPTILRTSSDGFIAIAEGRSKLSDHAENDIVMKRSDDSGKHWSKLQVIAEDGSNTLANPTLVRVGNIGKILLMYQRYAKGFDEHKAEPGLEGPHICRTWIQESRDEGRSWSPPKDITASVKRATGVTSTAVGPGVGIQLHRGPHAGRLLMPFNQGPYGHWKVYAAMSDDEGATWRMGATAPESEAGFANEVQFAEVGEGIVLLNARNQSGNKHRKVSQSSDGGETWQRIQEDPTLLEPECQASFIRYEDRFAQAIEPRLAQSDILLFSNPASMVARTNGILRLSLDGGQHWSRSYPIYPRGFAYSCLTPMRDQYVGCLFERDGYQRISFLPLSLQLVLGMGSMDR